MKKKLLLIAFFLCTCYALKAQMKSVTGKVVDAVSKESLIGVTISIPGTKTGTTTDTNGQFSLNLPNGTSKLLVTYIGYQEQTVSITGPSLNISLTADTKNLNDVVVVGYGTQKKKDLTGAIATISGEDITGRQTAQISESLQGAVPGVSVTRSSAAPG